MEGAPRGRIVFAHTGAEWIALSETLTSDELTELQSGALASANATITEDGELAGQ